MHVLDAWTLVPACLDPRMESWNLGDTVIAPWAKLRLESHC